jgi:hypothetical protein
MHPSDVVATFFLGPWVKPPGSVQRRQQVYLTLVHWYESAKFMPAHPELRDALLFCPTLKEAHKYAARRQAQWRPDWSATRSSVLVAGLAMLSLQRPDLGLATCDLSALREGLAPMGLPARFVEACLERFDIWRESPKIATFGAEIAPESTAGQKLTKIVTPMPTWTLVAPCCRRAAWRVHDWALTHYVPVSYVGGPDDRMSRALAISVVDAADQVIVFEERRAKRFDHVLQHAKLAKKKVTLELYDPGQQLKTPQLPGVS